MTVAPTIQNWIAAAIVCAGMLYYLSPIADRLGERFGQWLRRRINGQD